MTKKSVSLRSLENLTHEGRPTTHGEKKATHNVSVTPTGWSGVLNVARSFDLSVSELIEQVGRNRLRVEPNLEPAATEVEKVQIYKDVVTHATKLQEKLEELVKITDLGKDEST
jgi:hypothetical protein